MSYAITPSFSQPYSPLLVPNLYRYFNPSDATTITTVSGFISQINDKSLTPGNATQTTAGNRPSVGTGANQINGLNTINFDGTDDYLNFDGTGLAGSDYTVFIVERKGSGNNRYMLAGTTQANNRNLQLGYPTTPIINQGQYGNDISYNAGGDFSAVPRLWSFMLKAGVGRRLHQNGVLRASSSTTTQLTDYLGANIGGTGIGAYFGQIGSVIIYNRALTDAEYNYTGSNEAVIWGMSWTPV